MTFIDIGTINGFDYAIRKHAYMGHLCGYIGIPPGHPWYKLNYQEIDADVHGGLTFSEHMAGVGIEGDDWWIGFDCAHSNDIVPGMEKCMGPNPLDGPLHRTYKDQDYVLGEIASLSEQAASVWPPRRAPGIRVLARLRSWLRSRARRSSHG